MDFTKFNNEFMNIQKLIKKHNNQTSKIKNKIRDNTKEINKYESRIKTIKDKTLISMYQVVINSKKEETSFLNSLLLEEEPKNEK